MGARLKISRLLLCFAACGCDRAQARLLARKERRNGPLSPDCTFKPEISKASHKIDKTPKEMPRWKMLATDHGSEQKSIKLAKLARERDEKVMKECVFHPEVSKASHELVKNNDKLKRWRETRVAMGGSLTR